MVDMGVGNEEPPGDTLRDALREMVKSTTARGDTVTGAPRATPGFPQPANLLTSYADILGTRSAHRPCAWCALRSAGMTDSGTVAPDFIARNSTTTRARSQ